MYLIGFKHEFWFPCLVIILAQRCFLKALCHKIRVTFPGHFICNHYVTVTCSGRLFWSGRSFKSNCSKSLLGGNFFVVAFFGHFFGRFYGRVSRVKKLAIYSTWSKLCRAWPSSFPACYSIKLKFEGKFGINLLQGDWGWGLKVGV